MADKAGCEKDTRPTNIQLMHSNEHQQTPEDTSSSNGIPEEPISPEEDEVSPLDKDAPASFTGSHARKRSVLKRDDRPRTPSALQKRVSFSSSPSERRVSNGECEWNIFLVYLLVFWSTVQEVK